MDDLYILFDNFLADDCQVSCSEVETLLGLGQATEGPVSFKLWSH